MNNLKKTTLLFFVSVLMSTFVITGCKKDRIDEEEEKALNTYSSPNTYLNSKKQQEQEYQITSENGPEIIGEQGTRIGIVRSCLRKPNGDTVALPYTVKLVELYTPKDMIYYQMPTVAGGAILETDGEIRVRAFKDNEELTTTCPFHIQMPNATPKNYMKVFYGVSPTSVDWTDVPATSFTTPASDTIGYEAMAQKFGWINCGIKRDEATSYTLSFASTVDDLTNVAIFVYIPSTKTVMQVFNKVSGLIPKDKAVKIVAIGMKGSDLYSFSTDLTVSANTTVDVKLSSTTDAALTSLLDGL